MGKLRARSSTSDRFIDERDASENNLTSVQNASHRQTLPVGMLWVKLVQAHQKTYPPYQGRNKNRPVRCHILHFGGPV